MLITEAALPTNTYTKFYPFIITSQVIILDSIYKFSRHCNCIHISWFFVTLTFYPLLTHTHTHTHTLPHLLITKQWYSFAHMDYSLQLPTITQLTHWHEKPDTHVSGTHKHNSTGVYQVYIDIWSHITVCYQPYLTQCYNV